MVKIFRKNIASPLGFLRLSGDSHFVHSINFVNQSKNNNNSLVLAQCQKQLGQYFSGQRKKFALALRLSGTPFQLLVWQTLSQIPWGAVISYQDLADLMGRPRSVRAVANAVGANPIPIIIPCHRVIASDGSLGGYSGGLAKKKLLLRLENVLT